MTLKNDSEIHRAWLRRLLLEHERICLSGGFRLIPPVMNLSLGNKTLGHWNPRTRELSLSLELLQSEPWSTVLEILRHEMAHQIVSEIFKSQEGHGRLFREACQMTGAHPLSSRATFSLHRPPGHQIPLNPEEDRLIRRARKLLALSGSGNPHEAFLAMQKVRELSSRFNIEALQNLSEKPIVSAFISHRKKRTELWQSLTVAILSQFFTVTVIHTSLYCQHSLAEFRAFEIMGLERNVTLAEYIYWFIANNLPGLWRDFQKESGKKGIKARNQFYEGVISGIAEKMEKTEKSSELKFTPTPKTKGLMVLEAQRLSQFVRQRYPDLKTDTLKSRRWDSHAYEAGKKKGHELNLHRGINKQAGSEILYLDAASSKANTLPDGVP